MDILNRIKELKIRNDWAGIYQLFYSLNNSERNEAWNTAIILSEVGFACGKLAEISAHEIPRNSLDKEQFFTKKSQYRNESKRLRERCLELEPNNLTYLSSLAYFHYLNALELKQYRDRRDGNKKEEAETAIEYYNQILAIKPDRIKDLYRKGYILTEILPATCWGDGDVKLANQKRLEGIKSLQKAIQTWESLDSDNDEDKKECDRCRKEYIKSLYSTGSAYHEMIINKWDEAIFSLGLRKKVNREDKATYYPQDLENANNAWQYFYKCWQVDRPDSVPDNYTTNAACEGVDKLYSLGKVAFAQYWILSSNGQKKDEDVPQAIEYRDRAEKYLNEAPEFPWSDNKQLQKKDYIAERLARLYISKGEFEPAIKVINKYQTSKLDPYISHTLALALMLSKKYIQAIELLEKAANNTNNKDKFTSYFLIGCSLLKEYFLEKRECKLKEAEQYFQKAEQQKTTYSVLTGKARIAYIFGKKDSIKNLIEQANHTNPYCIVIKKYLKGCSTKVICPVEPVRSQSCDRNLHSDDEEVEDYTPYMYDAFGYDEDMGIGFDEYLDGYGYL